MRSLDGLYWLIIFTCVIWDWERSHLDSFRLLIRIVESPVGLFLVAETVFVRVSELKAELYSVFGGEFYVIP